LKSHWNVVFGLVKYLAVQEPLSALERAVHKPSRTMDLSCAAGDSLRHWQRHYLQPWRGVRTVWNPIHLQTLLHNNCIGGLGSVAYKAPPAGSGAEPRPKTVLVHFELERTNRARGDNKCSIFDTFVTHKNCLNLKGHALKRFKLSDWTMYSTERPKHFTSNRRTTNITWRYLNPFNAGVWEISHELPEQGPGRISCSKRVLVYFELSRTISVFLTLLWLKKLP